MRTVTLALYSSPTPPSPLAPLRSWANCIPHFPHYHHPILVLTSFLTKIAQYSFGQCSIASSSIAPTSKSGKLIKPNSGLQPKYYPVRLRLQPKSLIFFQASAHGRIAFPVPTLSSSYPCSHIISNPNCPILIWPVFNCFILISPDLQVGETKQTKLRASAQILPSLSGKNYFPKLN